MATKDKSGFCNESGVQSLYALTSTKIDPMVSFQFMQVADPNVIGLAMNLDMDTADADYTYSFIGSNPDDYSRYNWVFVMQSLSGLSIEFHVRQGILFMNGDWTSGAPGALSSVPAQLRVMQDTSITNTSRDMGFFKIEKKALS